MQPTPEIEAFIARIEALPPGPGISIDQALQPSFDEESELRRLFATDRRNKRLSNPYVGLVDVFDAPEAIRTTRARVIQDNDLSAKYVMPLSETNRRKEGTPSTVADLDEFKKNWSVFTEGSLSQLVDWNNVVAAGGAVLACLTPLDEVAKISKRSIRKYYHSSAYPTSDVDLFLWGLTTEQAEVKINDIYEAVRDSVPWDVTCIRTKHTISIHCQYPYRSVQIVLRLYHSPAEILAGFDIDAPCCAYDGNRVWANPRALVAMMRQCNTVDVTRRSPSYEVRLAKYSGRAFEVYVPALKRGEIDPTIFERSIARMEGLARLLVLEKLTDTDTRYSFLESRRNLRGRPNPLSRYNKRTKRKLKGDLKADAVMGGLEMNDYDVQSLHIPYGPGWDARRIDKLVYQTDLGMNSTFNPKNKGRRLHRHPAFFGTMAECLEDCCETCPQPIDEDERTLQKEEDENYIRGRISFIEENPGRQTMSGSFNPIDDGEWSEQVYIRPTQKLFAAIAACDGDAVQNLLQGDIDVNHRDHVGRTALHIAILSKASAIACDLIDAGARITARLVDGKAPLHLASQYDQVAIVRKLLEKSAQNVEESKGADVMDEKDEKNEKVLMPSKKAVERLSSDDDWSSHDDDDIEMVDAEDEDSDRGNQDDDSQNEEDQGQSRPKTEVTPVPETPSGDIPDDDEEEPDVIEIDTLDWDFGFSSLSYAILFASLSVIEELLAAGADPKLPTKPSTNNNSKPLHPLSLTILREDEDEACRIAERLIQAGASSTTADETMDTIFHAAVRSGRAKLVATLLRCDQHAHSVIDFPLVQYQNIIFPISTAINQQHYAVLAVMFAHGVKLVLDEVDISRAREATLQPNRAYMFGYNPVKNYLDLAYHPVETAMAHHDDLVHLLIPLSASVDIGLKNSMRAYSSGTDRRTLKDWIENIIIILNLRIENNIRSKVSNNQATIPVSPMNLPESLGWQKFYREYHESLKVHPIGEEERKRALQKAHEVEERERIKRLEKLEDGKAYFVDVKQLLDDFGAKTWREVYPDIESRAISTPVATSAQPQIAQPPNVEPYSYVFLTSGYSTRGSVPQHLVSSYDELYEACYVGDNGKIQSLCLPAESTKPGSILLNISVKMIHGTIDHYNLHGYTPLFTAVVARRWSTAKLILAIAAAQYHPEDDDVEIKFNIDWDESDNESCNSEDSDITVEKKEIKFIDIANRSSAIKSDVHPKKMLQQSLVMWRKGERTGQAHLLSKAVIDHDLEAFVHIANLYQTLPEAIEMGPAIMDNILEEDQPDILDEYIRRTGSGIDMKSNRKDSGDVEVITAINDENRIYLGLNVHGKKRADLARKNDPDANNEEPFEISILWKAVKSKARAIIEYLAGDRPLSAYRFYSSTHSDERAIWLRRVNDLEKLLPIWLGWTMSDVGDSPFMAAIIANDVDIIKLLFKKSPQIMAAALHQKIKFVGFNALSFAVHLLCDLKVIDYLLAKSISPAERDLIKGWNIYHMICYRNHGNLLEHFLRKLPRDVNEALLAHQSKERLNTPLHIAVKLGNIRLVKLIVEFTTSTILVPDVDGQTALHAAVKACYPQITSILLVAADRKGLQMENGVGNTPLDIISLGELGSRIQQFSQNQTISIRQLEVNGVDPFQRYSEEYIRKLEKELPRLHATIHTLSAEGKLKSQTKLATELTKFASMMAERVSAARVAEAARPHDVKEEISENKDPQDSPNIENTISIVLAASKNSTVNRQLIHLIDVQKSVEASLKKAGTSDNWRRQRDEDELYAEQDEDEKEQRQSMVWPLCALNLSADPI